MHCVDLGEIFPTNIYLQNLASIQPRTSPVKFARSCACELAYRSSAAEAGPRTRLANKKKLKKATEQFFIFQKEVYQELDLVELLIFHLCPEDFFLHTAENGP